MLTSVPTTPSARPLRRPPPLLLAYGALFWGLVIAGSLTGNTGLIGAAVAMFLIVAVAVIARAVRAAGARRAEQRRIWMEGQPARASVVALSPTGGSFNDHPYVDLELEVQRDGGAPYRVTVQALVSLLAIPRVQPRCEIAVHVDRADRTRLVIDPALTPYGYRS